MALGWWPESGRFSRQQGRPLNWSRGRIREVLGQLDNILKIPVQALDREYTADGNGCERRQWRGGRMAAFQEGILNTPRKEKRLIYVWLSGIEWQNCHVKMTKKLLDTVAKVYMVVSVAKDHGITFIYNEG